MRVKELLGNAKPLAISEPAHRREDCIYVAGTPKMKWFLTAAGKPGSYRTRWINNAALFSDWYEANEQCHGRKGWAPIPVAVKLEQFRPMGLMGLSNMHIVAFQLEAVRTRRFQNCLRGTTQCLTR